MNTGHIRSNGEVEKTSTEEEEELKTFVSIHNIDVMLISETFFIETNKTI
jgi:hypothetical protein